MIKANIYITFTKAISLLVLAVGSAYSFYAKDPNVMIFTLSISGGLAGLKSWNSTTIAKAQIESPTQTYVDPNQPQTNQQ